VDRLAEAFACMLIKLPVNRGFAAGVNAGIVAACSPYIVVLNDDVELDRHWLERTVSFLDERPDIAFCCGKIHQADGVLLDNAGDALSLGGSAWRLGFGRKDNGQFDLPRPVWTVSGTATLFRRSAFEQIGQQVGQHGGMFDEDFFSYLEDMDWSLRAARAGLQGFYLPQATCRHRGGATLGGADSAAVIRQLTQNQLLLLAKHYPAALLLRLAPRIAWAQILWALLAMRKMRFGAYLAGVAGFLRLLPGAIRRRVRSTPNERHALLARLRESEREIFADVSAPDRTERDTFWKLYFGLFPPRGGPAGKAPEGRKTLAHGASRGEPGVESPAPEGRQTPAPRSTHI
jgi:GT2 family glycosyltransferase